MGGVKKCQNSIFKVNFLYQKWSDSYSFFSLKNTNLEAHYLLLAFFDNINSKSLYFLKWCPIFDRSTLHQFSKLNNFLWVWWFLGKNLSNFVPPLENLTTPITMTIIHFQTSCFDKKRNKRMSRFHENWVTYKWRHLDFIYQTLFSSMQGEIIKNV